VNPNDLFTQKLARYINDFTLKAFQNADQNALMAVFILFGLLFLFPTFFQMRIGKLLLFFGILYLVIVKVPAVRDGVMENTIDGVLFLEDVEIYILSNLTDVLPEEFGNLILNHPWVVLSSIFTISFMVVFKLCGCC